MRAVLVLMLLLTTPSLAELRPVTRAVTVNPTNAALWFPDAEQFGAANEFVRRVESDGGITVFRSGTVVRLHVDIPDVSEFLTQPQADLLYQEIGGEGGFLTRATADTLYQPLGDYQPVGDYATGTPLYVETYLGTITGATITGGTVTTNSGVLEFTVEGGTGWTNLAFSGTGNAITNATAAGTTLTLERGTIEGGGGGTADPFSSILVEADWTWTNGIYAVGANTSVTNIAITLPDSGTNFTSVVIRKFSNLHQLRIMRGTNVVYTLYDDGATRAFDWWPQHTNWYWRN